MLPLRTNNTPNTFIRARPNFTSASGAVTPTPKAERAPDAKDQGTAEDVFQPSANGTRGTGEGEAIPFVMVGMAILLRTLLAQGASMSGKALLKKALQSGGSVVRQNGSHHIVKMPNGRQASIPVHGNKDLPIGTLRNIQKALGLE